jgi:GT2 family glycosyltransferase
MDVVGFCMLIRNKIFHIEKIMFDEGFVGPANEVDWLYRIRQKGWKSAWAKKAYVHHFGRVSFDGVYGKAEAQKLWNEGGKKLKEKYGELLRMQQ